MKTKPALLVAALFLIGTAPANADVIEGTESTFTCKYMQESLQSKQYVNSDGTVEVLLTQKERFTGNHVRFDPVTLPPKLNGASFKAHTIYTSPVEIYACLSEDNKAISLGYLKFDRMSEKEYERNQTLDRREDRIDRWYDRRERREDRRERYRY